MKRFYLAAGALLLGTSAFAWAPSSQPVAHSDKAPVAAKAGDAKAPATMLVAKSNDLPKAVKAEASSASWIADDQTLGDSVKTTDAVTMAAVETTPQPAAGTYPPCRPGPGDDHCIQLYEPGVRAQLASWQAPTGTLADTGASADTTLAAAMGGPAAPADTSAYTGVGGPDEPVDTTLAMNGDGSIDTGRGETAVDEGAATPNAYTGVGGPLEEVGSTVATTNYPPCRPGPGDDRCIQLYERGVTGR